MKQQRIILFALFCFAESCVAQMTQQEAFQLGNQSANAAARDQMTGSITETKAADVIRGYNPSNRPEGAANFGGNIITTLRASGTGKAGNCESGITDGTAGSEQHCEAVNAILKNQNNASANLITANDPLLQVARGILANPEQIAGKLESVYSDCKTVSKEIQPQLSFQTCDEWSQSIGATCTIGRLVTNDPEYLYQCSETISTINHSDCTYGRIIAVNTEANYQCNISKQMETHKCRRGFSAEIGMVVEEELLSDRRGGSNPQYTMQTWKASYTLSQLERATLTYWIADNWGQLWINNVLVFDDTGSPGVDFRYGVVTPCSSGNEWDWPPPPCGNYNHNVHKNGVYLAGMPPNRPCTWGCGMNLDLTSYLKSNEDNTIEIVCGNSWAIGPCFYDIRIEHKKPTFIGSLIDDKCKPFEERSQ